MTRLIASAFVDSVERFRAVSEHSSIRCVDGLEIRIDRLSETAAEFKSLIKAHRGHFFLVACRTESEGGFFQGNEIDAAGKVLELTRETGAAIDIAFDAWRSSAEIRGEVLKRLESDSKQQVILSVHYADVPAPLDQIARQILGLHPRVVAKIAYSAHRAVDSLVAIDLMKKFGSRVIAIAMGEWGSWTRILARKFNAFGTFAAMDQSAATAPGQYTVAQLIDEYHWNRMDEQTRVFGVVGDPVAHSLGPRLFQSWFREHECNAAYLPIRVDIREFEEFLSAISNRDWLSFGGLSVTLPHKEAALRWAAGEADPMSRDMGAANTVVFENGGIAAYNTDGYAAVESIAAALGCARSELAGKTVDVLGGGGSARAVCYSLCEMGCRVTVYVRGATKNDSFARWGVTVGHWEQRAAGQGEILINCTPVGMWPRVAESPMEGVSLSGRRLVFDLIYRPQKTKLLCDAEAYGCQTLSGLDMFVRQAATQFVLWIKKDPEQHKNSANATSRDREPAARAILANILKQEAEVAKDRSLIVLIGARGAGKSTVGALLAQLIGVPHIDTDAEVVRATGCSIAEIFAHEGEAGFRARESEAVQAAMAAGPAVVSVGGGALSSPHILNLIHERARVIWLTATTQELQRRIAADSGSQSSRPPLGGVDAVTELAEVLKRREPIYRSAADFTIDTMSAQPGEVAQRIATWVRRTSD